MKKVALLLAVVGLFVFTGCDQVVEIADKVGLGNLVRKYMPGNDHNVTSCDNTLKQLGLAITIFTNDNNNKMPRDISELADCGFNQEDFTCNATDTFDYTYFGNTFGTVKISRFDNPSTTPIAMENVSPEKEQIVILFMDGHTEVIDVNGRTAADIIRDVCDDQEIAERIILDCNLF